MPTSPNATGLEIRITQESIQQINDLDAQLRRAYAPSTVNNVLQRATLDGARAWRPIVASEIPGKRIKRAVRAKASQFIKPASYVGISLGKSRADKRGAYYAWIYVKGAKAHIIRTGGGELKARSTEKSKRGDNARGLIAMGYGEKGARALNTTKGLFAAVHHPGSKGKGPVVERAVESNLNVGVSAMAESIRRFLVNQTFRG